MRNINKTPLQRSLDYKAKKAANFGADAETSALNIRPPKMSLRMPSGDQRAKSVVINHSGIKPERLVKAGYGKA